MQLCGAACTVGAGNTARWTGHALPPPASTAFPQEPLGEEKQGGLGAAVVPEPPSGPFPHLHEGRGRRETPARQSCMCRIKAALRREEALQAFTERAALARGSLMGHKFLGRIVAC